MFRNKEVQLLIIMSILISIIAIITSFIVSIYAGWITIITVSLLIGCFYYFTRWRYREIEKLSHYLREISGGNYTLDVRDNSEGELSILKNEIYKVTNILLEQKTLLHGEKLHLTNAISDISHQLKTPLTSMTVMADLLVNQNLSNSKRLEFLNNIHIQLERLDWLVSSLLKLSKIDSGTVHFKLDHVNIKDLLEQSLESFLITIDVKQQEVVIKGEDSISVFIDFHWTKEALINVLKNCVEHTPINGKIEISFLQNVLYTEIIINDTGQGIAKTELPYIFQRFYKGKSSNEESVGIGLAMAHTIFTSQGGHIDVTSKEGKGTQFRIKLYHQHSSEKESIQ